MTGQRSHRQADPMRFMEMQLADGMTPCHVCVSHMTNQDGYLYKTWSVVGEKVKEPFYRFILRARLGWTEWPKHLEADHVCGVRACCRPDHLRPVERSDHKRVTNAARAAERIEAARCYWLATGCTGTALGLRFGVSFGQGCRWIRDWKADPDG